ncbi:MAG TPA: SRPBCC family protein [Gemmatimonadaceae bacterium]|nr:SRPBCC family protein [Gemmatimonadaceae bacterium]
MQATSSTLIENPGVTQSSGTPDFHSYPGLAVGEYLVNRWVWVPRPVEDVFPFFAAAENLGKITPPEMKFRIRTSLPIDMQTGALIEYRIGLYGIPMKWRTKITAWNPPHSFEDTQIAGPYAKWVHFHQFVEDAEGTTIIDRVTYSLPFGRLGRIARPLVTKQLKRIFDYREDVLTRIFTRQDRQ